MGSALRRWHSLLSTRKPDWGQICPPNMAIMRFFMRSVLPGYLPARSRLIEVRLTPNFRATSAQELILAARVNKMNHGSGDWLHMEHRAIVAVGDGFFRTVIAGGIGAFGGFFEQVFA